MDIKEKVKATLCAWIGHSRIISACFGYQYCGRCEAQIGDTLGGLGIGLSVGIGHNCDLCRKNYTQMTWRDKFLVDCPFTEPAK